MGLFRRAKERTGAEPVVELGSEPIVDLTRTGEKKPQWGFPTHCPDCGDYGYLDRIDVVNEIMFQHCPTCWARWETPRSATVDA